MAASPDHIFAMKALAARTRDIDDLRLLAGILGVTSAREALQICAGFYPDEPLSLRSAAVLQELFGCLRLTLGDGRPGLAGTCGGCHSGPVEPVSLIVAALIAGAAAGVKGTMTNAVTDAYQGLKALVLRRFAGRPAGETALERLPDDPEAWTPTLLAELEHVKAGSDEGLVEVAQHLMALLDAEGTRAGRYQVDARGAQGVQVGDHGTQHNVFNAPNE
jgi:hypothetical protein